MASRNLPQASLSRLGSDVMKEHNILPYDGHAVLIDDSIIDFDWPAITQAILETIPWRTETARIFGREMPVQRMTAWFGETGYTYSGNQAVAPVPLHGDDCFRDRHRIARFAISHDIGCAWIRVGLAMRHAHPPAERDVPAGHLAVVVGNGDEPEIVRKHVDIV